MSWIKPEVAVETLERESAAFDQIAMHARTVFSLSLTLAVLATAVLTFLADNGRDLQAFVNTRAFALAFGVWLITISFAAVFVAIAQWDLLLSRLSANRIARTRKVPDSYHQLKGSKLTVWLYASVPLFYVSILYSFLTFTGGVIGFFTPISDSGTLSAYLLIYSGMFMWTSLLYWIAGRFDLIWRAIKRGVRAVRELIADIRRSRTEEEGEQNGEEEGEQNGEEEGERENAPAWRRAKWWLFGRNDPGES